MLNRIRSIFFVAVLTITVVPYALMVLVMALPLSARHQRQHFHITMGWLHFAIWAARFICGVRYELKGAEVLEALSRAGTPVVVAPKHQSTWETFALPTIVPRQLCFVFKRALLYIPFFGWAMATLRMIHIDRSKGSEAFSQVVEQGKLRLAEGCWIIMFPEGTRTAVGATTHYKTGAARLALRTGAVVVPIAVNSGELWPRKSLLLRPGVITVSIGPPISSEGMTPDRLTTALENWVEGEMRRLSPHAYRNNTIGEDVPHGTFSS
jgi:1-acyl-sn-glycerol-3-phosphate acyltransferase